MVVLKGPPISSKKKDFCRRRADIAFLLICMDCRNPIFQMGEMQR
jgi:hypothetical protein